MSNRFVKNTSWILIGQVVRLIVSFISAALTNRYLGPANMGIINYSASYISFFTSLVSLGLNSVIIYELVNNRDKEGKILGTAILMRFFTGIISFFAFMGIMFTVNGDEKLLVEVAFLQSLQLPFLCFDSINYWYQSNLNSKYTAAAQTIAYIFSTAYKIALIIIKEGTLWFALASTLDIIILSGFYIVLYQKQKTQRLGFSWSIAKRLLRNCLPFILANIMVVIYGKMDTIMIKHLLDGTAEVVDTQVGLYTTTIALCNIIGFIPIAILDSGRPLIAEAQNKGEYEFNVRFRQIVAGIIWVCVAYSLFITVFSKHVIYIVNGKDYLGANICFKIAVWYTSFSYLGSAKNFWLVCKNKKHFVFIFSCTGAVCNLIMNFIFIPMWGINGAAIATLVTQILTNFVVPMLFKDTREYTHCVFDAILLRNMQLKEILTTVKVKLFGR